MAKRRIRVNYRKDDGFWEIKADDSERYNGSYASREEAITDATRMANESADELFIYDDEGNQFQSHDQRTPPRSNIG